MEQNETPKITCTEEELWLREVIREDHELYYLDCYLQELFLHDATSQKILS